MSLNVVEVNILHTVITWPPGCIYPIVNGGWLKFYGNQCKSKYIVNVMHQKMWLVGSRNLSSILLSSLYDDPWITRGVSANVHRNRRNSAHFAGGTSFFILATRKILRYKMDLIRTYLRGITKYFFMLNTLFMQNSSVFIPIYISF